MITQADRIIRKFGGARKLAKLLGVDNSTVYKWTYSVKRKGTGGHIPAVALKRVIALARPNGILLTQTDLSLEIIREILPR